MALVKRFEDLEAFLTAREMTQVVYEFSSEGTFARDFGLKDQMRRAAVSVMSNIAEGFESRTRPRFIDYLGIAKASCGELRAQCYVALDAKHITREQFARLFELTDKCIRQISNLLIYLQKSLTVKSRSR